MFLFLFENYHLIMTLLTISKEKRLYWENDFLLSGSAEEPFSLHKKELTRKNRQECISIIEDIFGDGSSMHNDLIAINFFALVTS